MLFTGKYPLKQADIKVCKCRKIMQIIGPIIPYSVCRGIYYYKLIDQERIIVSGGVSAYLSHTIR